MRICCSESSGHCPGGAQTSDHWHVGSPGAISLPPNSMSCFRQRNTRVRQWREGHPRTALPPVRGRNAGEVQGGCEAVSEGSRHSELVGVTGSPRICKGEWQGVGGRWRHRPPRQRPHHQLPQPSLLAGFSGKGEGGAGRCPTQCGGRGAGAEGQVVPWG